MRRSVLPSMLVVAACLVCPAQDKATEIDGLMTIYHDCGNFDGSVLVAMGGKVIYRKSFGLANREWDVPNTPDTKFRIGSMTKQFTAMLVMQLIEEGKLKLDGRIADILPNYRSDIGAKVTIHHLLTHTSGIPSYTSRPDIMSDVAHNRLSVTEFIDKYCSRDLEFPLGTKFAYSNSGYFILGAIIEKVTGKKYEEVLREKILDPVGMKDTGHDHPEHILKKRAKGYFKTKEGVRNEPPLDMTIPFSAGAMYSTVEDLYLWDQALYGETLLSQEYKTIMFTPGLGNCACGWFVRTIRYGEMEKPVTLISHGGRIGGFQSEIYRMIGEKNLIVLLHNGGPTPLERMADNLMNLLYGKRRAGPEEPLGEPQ